MTDTRKWFVSPTGIPYWSHGKKHQRARVKFHDDGSVESIYEEASNPNGPWVECPKMTLNDLDTILLDTP